MTRHVYLLVMGEYSDYMIIGVFDTEANARAAWKEIPPQDRRRAFIERRPFHQSLEEFRKIIPQPDFPGDEPSFYGAFAEPSGDIAVIIPLYKYLCEECDEEMKPTGKTLLTAPPKVELRCPKCKKTKVIETDLAPTPP